LQSRLQGENDEQITIGSAGSSRQFRWLGLRVRFNTNVSPGKMPGLCFCSAGIHCRLARPFAARAGAVFLAEGGFGVGEEPLLAAMAFSFTAMFFHAPPLNEERGA
jgi:hypothetical protein